MSRELSSQLSIWRILLCIRASGIRKQTRGMAEVFKFGQTGLGMTAFGKTEWLVAMADSCMLRAMFMRVPGQRIKPTALVYTHR